MAKGESELTTIAQKAPPPEEKTGGGITSASQAKYFGQLQKYGQEKLGIKVGYSLHDIDFQTVKDAVSEIETIINEFPQAKGAFKWLSGNNKKKNAFAAASFEGGIDLNGKKYKDLKSLGQDYLDNVNDHFHPMGTTVKHITTHEAGHILEKALIEKAYPGNDPWTKYSKITAWNNCTLAKDIVGKALETVKNDLGVKGVKYNKSLMGTVSFYAQKNKSECLAECVADYVANGEKAKPLSKAVWKELKKELG